MGHSMPEGQKQNKTTVLEVLEVLALDGWSSVDGFEGDLTMQFLLVLPSRRFGVLSLVFCICNCNLYLLSLSLSSFLCNQIVSKLICLLETIRYSNSIYLNGSSLLSASPLCSPYYCIMTTDPWADATYWRLKSQLAPVFEVLLFVLLHLCTSPSLVSLSPHAGCAD